MARSLRSNGLAIFFGVILLASLAGQAVAGHADYNNQQVEHAQLTHSKAETISFGRYLTSSSYGQTVMENWQSEYLQFLLFVLATVWFVQRGSPESKELDRAGRESVRDQKIDAHASPRSPKWARVGGLRTALYSNSLALVMGLFFFGSWFAQSVTGWSAYNADQLQHDSKVVSWLGYLGTASFWEDTLQNWQSEFLAVGSMAILAVYLRQRGSPESKPVGAPHEATGSQG
jgi:uncharacterized protein DUF6766